MIFIEILLRVLFYQPRNITLFPGESNMTKKKFKRRQYIVDRNFQYGFIRKIALLSLFIFLGSIGVFVLVYHVSEQFQGNAVAQPDPFSLSGGVTLTESPKISTLLVAIWPFILGCILLTIIVTFFWGVIVSHRMAGPVFRMRKVLSQMEKGDVSGPVEKLRNKDDFKSLFNDIQSVKIRWQGYINELQQICNKLENHNQKELVDKLQKIISSFKTN